MSATARLAPLITALAALLLASCATEEDPVPIFEEPSATPTASSSAAPEKDPHRSPRAVIRHWNTLLNEAYDGDTTAWRELTPECRACADFADQVEEIYEQGGFIKGGNNKILSITKDEEFSSGVFRVEVDSPPSEYQETAGGPVQSFPGGVVTYRVYLAEDGDNWLFYDYAQLAT